MTGLTMDSVDVTVVNCSAVANVGHGLTFSPGAARLVALVSRLTWEPGSMFRVEHGPEGATFHVRFDTICAYGKGATTLYGDVTWAYEGLDKATDRDMLGWIRHYLHDLVMHEADEWLTLDGTRHPFDPHRLPADPSPFPPRRRLSLPWRKV